MNPRIQLKQRAVTIWMLVASTIATVIVAACTQPEPTPTPTPQPPNATFSMSALTVMAPMTVTFSIDEPSDNASYQWDFGDGNSNSGSEVEHTYLDAGSFTVRLNASRNGTNSEYQDSVRVQPGVAGWITLDANALTLESGDTHQFQITAYDDLGNQIQDPNIQWSATHTAGSVNQDGLFTAGYEIGFTPEGVTAVLQRGGQTVEQIIPVEIIYSELASISVEPPEIDTRVTWSVDMHATAIDATGHTIEDAEISWEILRPGDSIDQTGFYSPSDSISEGETSLLLVRANYKEQEIEQIIKGKVNPGILDRIEIPESLESLEPDDQVQLSVKAFDRFGNDLTLDKVEWNIKDPAAGTITPEGLFTAGTKSGKLDEDTLQARGFKDGIQTFQFIPVSIQPSAAQSIRFLEPNDSIPAGSGATIQLEVLDIYGNPINDVDVYVEVTGGGELVSGNVFRSGLEEGHFEDAIIARIVAGDAGNNQTIEAKTDVTIRKRSSDFIAIDLEGPQGTVIYLINLATSQLIPITADAPNDQYSETTPTWWPDGSRLAFAYDISGTHQIYDVDPFRNHLRQITDIEDGAIMPDISPDGSQIVFIQMTDWAWQVYSAPINTDDNGNITIINSQHISRISPDEELRHILPAWSPDGDWILYTSINRNGSANALVVNADNPTKEQGLEVRGAAGLAWHPNGETILLAIEQDDPNISSNNKLILLDLETGDYETLDTGDMGALVATFSPDGSEIAFIDDQTGAMWLMDTDGTGIRQALGAQHRATITAWRPRDLIIPTPKDQNLGNTPLTIPNADLSNERFDSPAHGTIGPYTAILETDLGEIHIDLYNHIAPLTVQNFINLINQGYYNGLSFHTVDPESAVFTGSIVDAFGGTAGYYIPSEYHPEALHNISGAVSMLNTGEHTASAEFIITLEPKPEWDAFVDGAAKNCQDSQTTCYAVFGKVIQGIEIIQQFEAIDRFSEDVTPHRIIEARIIDRTAESPAQ